MSTPSIALIPSGYKSGKLYSQLPVNGDGDLTFARVGDANRVNENGLIEEMATGVPRLDYSDGGCPSLLVEPSSTNLIQYSEDFSDSSWSKNNGATVQNGYLSPDGNNNAYKLNLINSGSQVGTGVSGLDTSKEYTFSVWLRTETGTLDVDLGNIASGIYETFTINENWQRYEVTQTPTATTRFANIDFNQSGSFLAWGAQVEEQPYATSYIPNNGNAAGETRDAETVSKSGLSDYINSSEGVLFAELSYFDSDDNCSLTLSDNTTDNRVTFRRLTNGFLSCIVVSNGSVVFSNSSILSLNEKQFYKIAFKYKTEDFAIWVDGVELFTNNSSATPLNLSKIDFAQGISTSDEFFGKVKDLRVYKTALSDTELQTLTS